MKALVAGFGYVGQELARLLIEEGHEVWALSRRGPAATLSSEAWRLLPGLKSVQADLTQPLVPGLFPRDLDVFFFMPSPGERSDAAYEGVFVHGMGHLVEALPRVPGIMVSSTSVYHQSEGAVVDDTSPAEPETDPGRRLRQAENLLLTNGAAGSAVLRSSGIYGPGRTRLLSTLVHHTLEESLEQVSTCRIHRTDLARALCFAWQGRLSGTMIASDPNPACLGEMSAWAEETFSTPERRALLEAPPRPARAGSRANRRLVPSRLLAAGFSFRYPSFREGYRAIVGLD